MMILMYKIYQSIRTFCFYHSQALWNLSWWTSEVTYPRWRPGAVDRFDEGKMVVPLGWYTLSNQPHIQPYIVGIYGYIYISPVKGWNCHGIASFLANSGHLLCHSTKWLAGGWWCQQVPKIQRCNASAWPRLPKLTVAHSCMCPFFQTFAGLKMILSHGCWRTRWVLTAQSHVMGLRWNSGRKELADRDAPKPKVQVCCEPQQMPEGQKARFEPTFCTCVPCK